MTPPVLVAEALAVGYPARRGAARVLLEELDLTLTAGELTCLLGANGSGKSTLLRTLAGMQPPLGGVARLGGDDVAALRPMERARRLAVVLTDRLDVGILRAVDLVALGRYPHTGWDGRLGPADRRAVRWALEATQASALARRSVAELSDGERQRVLIARALAQEPALLALDEPTAFIDGPSRVELARLLRHLARECGLAVLLTTHDVDLALRTADVVWLIEPSAQRSRLHVGAPEDLALRGVVGRAFDRAEVAFDLRRAAFVPRAPALVRVRVRGDELPARWAARAVEREGLAVAGAGQRSDLTVDVRDGAGGARWRLRSALGTAEGTTIGALAVEIRGQLPHLAAAQPSSAPAPPTAGR